MEKTLKQVIQERKDACMGVITRRSRKSLRRSLARAKLGRWTGFGANRKFVPLTRKETDELLLMVRHNHMSDMENEENIIVDEGVAMPVKKSWGWGLHTPIISRPGLLKESWHKGVPVKIRAKAYAKMVCYCQAVGTEISGFGKTVVTKDANDKVTLIEVVDVMIFKQECTGGYTELNQDALSNFLYELAKANENPADWNLWWHTHNDFGVFWSGVDDTNITRLIETFHPEFLLSTCINKKCDLISRIDSLDEKGKQLSSNNTVSVVPMKNFPGRSKCLAQVKKLVTQKKYEYKGPIYAGHSRSFYSHSDVYGNHSNFDARDSQHQGDRWKCHICGERACLLVGGKYICTTHWQAQNRGENPQAQRMLPSLQHAVGLSNKQRRDRGFPQDVDLEDYRHDYELSVNERVPKIHEECMPFYLDG